MATKIIYIVMLSPSPKYLLSDILMHSKIFPYLFFGNMIHYIYLTVGFLMIKMFSRTYLSDEIIIDNEYIFGLDCISYIRCDKWK